MISSALPVGESAVRGIKMNHLMMNESIIGIVAGNGRFPVILVEYLRKAGKKIVVAGINGETDTSLPEKVDRFIWLGLGELNNLIKFFQAEGVKNIIMAGQVKHHRLFENIKFDFRALKLLTSLLDRRADSLLKAVIKEIESAGLKVLPSNIYLKDLLSTSGNLTAVSLTPEEKSDIDFGWPLARKIAEMDIGQTLVVKGKTVVAVEAMEGTDECIRRAAKIAGSGLVVIKVARPKQDLRFDLPVVGLRTIAVLQEVGSRVLVVEAARTLLLDKPELLNRAKQSGIAIIGKEEK